MVDISEQEYFVLLWSRLALVGPILLAPFFLYFSIVFPQDKKRISLSKYILLFIPTILLLIFTPTRLNIERVINIPLTGPPEVQAGFLYYPFSLYLLLYMGAALYILFRKMEFSSPLRRAQIKFVFVGVISALILSVITNVILLLMEVSQAASIGPFFSIIFVASIAYAIVAHRLFDIRVIIKRTFVYSALLAFVLITYSLIVFSFAALFGKGGGALPTKQEFIPNIIAAIAIAIGFEPIRKWLEKKADKFLFVGQYNQDEVLKELGVALAASVDLTEVLHNMMQTLIKAMRLNFGIFFVIKDSNNSFPKNESKLSRIETLGISKTKITEEFSSKLILYFKTLKDVIVREELEHELEEKGRLKGAIEGQIVKFMAKIGVAIAVPVFIEEKLIGVLMLSEKKSGDIFTDQDLKLLNIVSLQTVSAIERDRLYEEDQLKSEFVSIASHELLTPTAAIEGYLSMILDEHKAKVDKTAQRYLIKVYDSSRRLSRLVKDLLNVSRIESGRLKIEPKEFDLGELVSQVIEELQIKAQAGGLELKPEKPKSAVKVWADPERIHQVIYNLVSNSIKYSKKGTVLISLSREGKMAKLVVTDQGIGISPKDLKHIFDKFYRAESRNIADVQGTGLGLYISKNIVELSGGKIGAKSQLGKGSSFWFTLPVEKLRGGAYNKKTEEKEKS
jgi:signal transduction histidine kinase